jgi:1-phosphofructokinase family hexose kinase
VILCVAANPSVDRLFTVERLVPGEIHRPAEFVQVAGGKGLNVARAAAALGAPVEAAALLGGHAGRWIAEQLEAAGIGLHATWAEAETRSSLSVAGALEEGLTEFYEHGFPVSDAEWRRFARLVGELAPAARWVTLSGSLPGGAPREGYRPMIGRTRTAFDSREPGIDARPDVVKVNDQEAALLTGRPVESREAAVDAARALHAASGGTAIVTRGEHGAVMLLADGWAFEGAAPVTGRYPVGSGDAFLAGLVVALDRGAGWEDALRAALGAGAANAELPGAAVLDGARARELAAAAAVQRLV